MIEILIMDDQNMRWKYTPQKDSLVCTYPNHPNYTAHGFFHALELLCEHGYISELSRNRKHMEMRDAVYGGTNV